MAEIHGVNEEKLKEVQIKLIDEQTAKELV